MAPGVGAVPAIPFMNVEGTAERYVRLWSELDCASDAGSVKSLDFGCAEESKRSEVARLNWELYEVAVF